MTVSYRISSKAQRDFSSIWRHQADDSESAAQRYQLRLLKGMAKLAQNPYMGTMVDELQVGLRFFTVRKHVIYYEIVGSSILIVRVLHGSQDRDNFHFNA